MIKYEVIEEADAFGVALIRQDIKSIKIRNGVTVAELRAFIEGLDDNLELDLDYYLDVSLEGSYLDAAELYYITTVTKTEEDLLAEIKAVRSRILRQEEQKVALKLQDMNRISSLELELKALKEKHGL